MTYIATMKAKPGKRAELLALLQELVDAAADEPGTLVYVFNTVEDDPDTVISYEVFSDRDAVTAHSSSAAVATVVPRLGDLVAESSIRRGAPVTGKGLPAAPHV